MSVTSSLKLMLIVIVTVVFLIPLDSQDVAAQGIYAGRGQGFRIGGARFGMHFGGGQGTSIGGPNFGMRFGNGQGARFGAGQYGMQFGGRQGTQIGVLSTTPNVNPGTYFYDDVRRTRGNYGQSARTFASGSTGQSYPGTVGTPTPSIDTPSTSIRLTHPPTAQTPIQYTLNGTPFRLAPGHSVYMAAGQNWDLEFSAGEGFGERVATLNESGNYIFTHSEDEGWVLNEELPVAQTPAPQMNAPIQNAPVQPTDTPPLNGAQPAVKPQPADNEQPNSLLDKMPLDKGASSVLETESTPTELIVDPKTPTQVDPPKSVESGK